VNSLINQSDGKTERRQQACTKLILVLHEGTLRERNNNEAPHATCTAGVLHTSKFVNSKQLKHLKSTTRCTAGVLHTSKFRATRASHKIDASNLDIRKMLQGIRRVNVCTQKSWKCIRVESSRKTVSSSFATAQMLQGMKVPEKLVNTVAQKILSPHCSSETNSEKGTPKILFVPHFRALALWATCYVHADLVPRCMVYMHFSNLWVPQWHGLITTCFRQPSFDSCPSLSAQLRELLPL